MQFAAIVLIAFSLVVNACAVEEQLKQHLWSSFKKTHSKTYFSDEHETSRYGIFKKNIDLIEKHNSEYSLGIHTYTLGVNVFADWTIAEFREKMLGTRFNMTYKKNGSAGTFSKSHVTAIKVPDSVDWRELGAVTEVKNQGQCGSCWAFSTTGSLEGAHYRATQKLLSLSEQQLVDCAGKFNNNGCNGGLMDNAFEYIKSVGGLEAEQVYPYHAHKGRCHYKNKLAVASLTGFIDVKSGCEESLKEAVATSGPVSVAIDATQEKFMLYRDGVFVDDSCKNSMDDLDHGVLVVGYGTDSMTRGVEGRSAEPMDYWIVKNSWGTTWGEQGYVRMARNMNNMCGVATSASYPLVKPNKSQ